MSAYGQIQSERAKAACQERACPKCEKVLRTNVGAFKTHLRYCGRDYLPVFWGRVQKGEGCWLWTGALQRDGYAHFTLDRKTISAHRFAYEKLVGPIPEGMDLLHSCDVRHCVNPEHLRPGTHHENMLEMIDKGRNPQHTLKPDQVREIREALKARYHGIGKDLAKKYNVKAGVISDIFRGYTYGYVK